MRAGDATDYEQVKHTGTGNDRDPNLITREATRPPTLSPAGPIAPIRPYVLDDGCPLTEEVVGFLCKDQQKEHAVMFRRVIPGPRSARPLMFAMVICSMGSCGTDEVGQAGQPQADPPVAVAPVVAGGEEVEATPPVAAEFPKAAEHAQAALEYRIIDAPNGTFGYDILSNGRLFVHQTNLPGRPGIEGCRTREEAERLAAFVMDKIRRGEMPPSVTQEELDSLKIQ